MKNMTGQNTTFSLPLDQLFSRNDTNNELLNALFANFTYLKLSC